MQLDGGADMLLPRTVEVSRFLVCSGGRSRNSVAPNLPRELPSITYRETLYFFVSLRAERGESISTFHTSQRKRQKVGNTTKDMRAIPKCKIRNSAGFYGSPQLRQISYVFARNSVIKIMAAYSVIYLAFKLQVG